MSNNIKQCCRTKHRVEDEKKYLKKRLSIIEGQVRGVIGMIEDDRYCSDVLIQISAISKGLESLGEELIKNHMKTCVVEDIKSDKLETIDEVIDLYKKLYK